MLYEHSTGEYSVCTFYSTYYGANNEYDWLNLQNALTGFISKVPTDPTGVYGDYSKAIILVLE